MLKRIDEYITRLLEVRRGLAEDELYRFVLMMTVSIASVSVHVLYTVFFLVVGSVFLAVSHTLGVLVFAVAWRLLMRRHYDIAGILLSVMIIVSTAATVAVVGGDSYSNLYLLLVLLMQLIIPFTNRRIPLCFCVLLPLLMIGCYFVTEYGAPLQPIAGIDGYLAVFNILVVSLGMIILIRLERYVRQFVDTYQRKRIDELEAQANVDPLTGLYNRRYATEVFSQIAHAGDGVSRAVAIGDIDDFKRVNDTWGHDAGDLVLQMVSAVLRAYLRKSDRIIRWGGEEFLLVLEDVDLGNAAALLERARARPSRRRSSRPRPRRSA